MEAMKKNIQETQHFIGKGEKDFNICFWNLYASEIRNPDHKNYNKLAFVRCVIGRYWLGIFAKEISVYGLL